jgi:predicted kinase
LAAKLVVFSGLPGVGKSTLARAVADRMGGVWLRVDTVEASLLKAGLLRSFETGLAAYIVAQDLAAVQLDLGRTVVIDAVNGVVEAQGMWPELAEAAKVELRIIEVTCSDEAEHRRRVESRASSTPPLPTPTWEEVRNREYVPWNRPLLSVDGSDGLEPNLARILSFCDGAA